MVTDTTPDETAGIGENDRGGERGSAPARTTDGELDSFRRLRAVSLGLAGGGFATLLMTLFRMPISDSLPPTANLLARYVGGDPEDYPWSSMILHFGYGAGGGGLFGLLFSECGDPTRDDIELRAIALGLGYSLAFSLFGSRIILGRVVGMDLDDDEALIFHIGHAIYGLALGAWIGSKR